MGKNGFENITRTARVFATMLDNYELKNTSHLINSACLINSNFSADGELEKFHENCHLLRAIERALLL